MLRASLSLWSANWCGNEDPWSGVPSNFVVRDAEKRTASAIRVSCTPPLYLWYPRAVNDAASTCGQRSDKRSSAVSSATAGSARPERPSTSYMPRSYELRTNYSRHWSSLIHRCAMTKSRASRIDNKKAEAAGADYRRGPGAVCTSKLEANGSQQSPCPCSPSWSQRTLPLLEWSQVQTLLSTARPAR